MNLSRIVALQTVTAWVALTCLNTTIMAKDLATIDDATISVESATSALKALGPQGEMVLANPELRKRFVDHIVNSFLVAQKARAEGFDKKPEFQARLADVTTQLLAGEYMDAMIAKKTADKDVKNWFNSNKKLFSKREIHAMHILCEDENTAKKALAEVQNSPADFEKVAKKYSKDKTVDLGFFGSGRMVQEFERVAFATKPGTIAPAPVKTNFGWHIIKVIETRGSDNVAFDAVKEEVRRKYRQKIQEDLVHDLRSKKKIAINEQSLKEIKLP
jgi:peptidyl-prolyl cis-trans isomerase C